jgi:GntR family transcriptional regulator
VSPAPMLPTAAPAWSMFFTVRPRFFAACRIPVVAMNAGVILHYNTNAFTQQGARHAGSCASAGTTGRPSMNIGWNDNAPIYRQLKDRVIGMMLDGILKAGDALPSVRQIAAEYQLNPITVSKAYQELVDENLVEKRRGIGMYVTEGASEKLLASERERFLSEEWPAMVERIRLLGLNVEQLLRTAEPGGAA